MNFRLLHDRIAIRQIKVPKISKGGIYVGEFVDDGHAKEIMEGEVISVGPGIRDGRGKLESMWGIQAGDRVRYSPVCSVTQTIEGVEVTIIRRDAVVGLVEKSHG